MERDSSRLISSVIRSTSAMALSKPALSFSARSRTAAACAVARASRKFVLIVHPCWLELRPRLEEAVVLRNGEAAQHTARLAQLCDELSRSYKNRLQFAA